MNTRLALVVFALAACAPSAREETTPGPVEVGRGGGGEEARGGADQAAVGPALEDAKARLVTLDGTLEAEEDADARVALALDRVALASFVADLEACLAGTRACPDSLDEPGAAPDGSIVPTAAAWPGAARSLARDGCACRTHACAMAVLDELARWNDALDPRGLDAAAEDETRARECVARRLGR